MDEMLSNLQKIGFNNIEKHESDLKNYLINNMKKINNVILYGDVNYTDDKNNTYAEKWQIIFKQFSNPQAIEYLDIRRVGYNATMQCIVNKVASQLI